MNKKGISLQHSLHLVLCIKKRLMRHGPKSQLKVKNVILGTKSPFSAPCCPQNNLTCDIFFPYHLTQQLCFYKGLALPVWHKMLDCFAVFDQNCYVHFLFFFRFMNIKVSKLCHSKGESDGLNKPCNQEIIFLESIFLVCYDTSRGNGKFMKGEFIGIEKKNY